jgi:N-acyl-D-aspartate/D-glutamate deacylase
MTLPIPERLQALSNADVRKQLAASAKDVAQNMRWITDWGAKVIAETFSLDMKKYQGRVVADIAKEEDKDPFDALLDIVCADGLRATFSLATQEMSRADWEAAIGVWRDGRAIIGASDAGAHLDFTGNFDYSAYVLEHAVRKLSLLSLEEAVHLLTDVPAQFYGLRNRGRLDIGAWADMVVFDPGTVATTDLQTRFDLPGGAGRLYSEPVGITSVYVNGEEIVHRGEVTSARPGRILRSGVDTETPKVVP